MQSIYAMHQSKSDNLEREEKFLLHSLDNVQDLYLVMISSLLEIKKMEENFLLEQGGQCFPGFFLEIFYCALIFLRQKSPIAN